MHTCNIEPATHPDFALARRGAGTIRFRAAIDQGMTNYANTMLEVRNLSVAYGGLRALNDVSLTVAEGQFVTVVGPNGAGKSTLFKTICGMVPPSAGSVSFRGENLIGRPAASRAHLGIAHVPEGRQVFKTLTVRENLEMGAYPKAARAQWHHTLERIHTLFPILAERATQLAGTLSGGEQQMVAIGRGLASAPQLLMLDEPSMGLAPTVADTIFERISQIHREDGVTILLVEQRVAEALELSDHGYVLETGHMVLDGTYETLLADDRVRRSYLGLTDA
jgi:branched-chain amino acid transport system ATP-binding protein